MLQSSSFYVRILLVLLAALLIFESLAFSVASGLLPALIALVFVGGLLIFLSRVARLMAPEPAFYKGYLAALLILWGLGTFSQDATVHLMTLTDWLNWERNPAFFLMGVLLLSLLILSKLFLFNGFIIRRECFGGVKAQLFFEEQELK